MDIGTTATILGLVAGQTTLLLLVIDRSIGRLGAELRAELAELRADVRVLSQKIDDHIADGHTHHV